MFQQLPSPDDFLPGYDTGEGQVPPSVEDQQRRLDTLAETVTALRTKARR